MRYKVCQYPWLSPIISCYGDVGVCCNDIHFILKLGNIKKNSLKEIWTNKKAEQLRFLHITNQLEKTPDKICLKCRQSLEVPTLNDEYVVDYLKTINRDDLIEFYLYRIRRGYALNFRYKEKETKDKIIHKYPVYSNLIKTKHFRYREKGNSYVGSDKKLTFYLKIPKKAFLMQIKFYATGIKSKAQFTAYLDNMDLGTYTVEQMSKGEAETFSLVAENIKELKKKEIVKFELRIKGNLAIYERGIIVNYYKTQPPFLAHGKIIKLNKAIGANKMIFHVKSDAPLTALKLWLTALNKHTYLTINGKEKILVHKMAANEYEGHTIILNKNTIEIQGEVALRKKKVLKGYFKDKISIYKMFRKGNILEYNNEDNFNKGYKFLILEEAELLHPLNAGKVRIHLASIEDAEAEISMGKQKYNLKPAQLASGVGKIYEFEFREKGILKIKAVKGKLAVLEKPIEKHLPRTPIEVIN